MPFLPDARGGGGSMGAVLAFFVLRILWGVNFHPFYIRAGQWSCPHHIHPSIICFGAPIILNSRWRRDDFLPFLYQQTCNSLPLSLSSSLPFIYQKRGQRESFCSRIHHRRSPPFGIEGDLFWRALPNGPNPFLFQSFFGLLLLSL